MTLPQALHGELAIGRQLHVFATFVAATHFAQSPRSVAIHLLREDHLLARCQVVGRGSYTSGFIRLRTANENNGAAIGRDPQACDRCAIVS